MGLADLGWTAPLTSRTHLEELTGVAEAVEEKFTMVEVHDYNSWETNTDSYRKVATDLEKQEERLVLLETLNFNLNNRWMAEFFLTLQKKCMEWRVNFFTVSSVPDPKEYWAFLDKICSSNGQISIIVFMKSQEMVRLESVRKASEISDKMSIWADAPLGELSNVRGVRDTPTDEREAEWEQAVGALW